MIPAAFFQVIYMFIQIWVDRAVSELMDADGGPRAWGTPSVPSPPSPSSTTTPFNDTVGAPPPPSPSLTSPLEALLRRCYRLLNPEGVTSSGPAVEFKEASFTGTLVLYVHIFVTLSLDAALGFG